MTCLDRMLLKKFFIGFSGAMLFFVLILQMVELFSYLVTYVEMEVSVNDILKVSLLYIPKTIIFALPLSLLFSISFTMGNLYAHNELAAVFSSGVSLYRFTAPILIIGFLASVFSFYFENTIVIPTFRQKVQLQNSLVQQGSADTELSQEHVTVLGAGSHIIYHASFYNHSRQSLNNPFVIIRSTQNKDLEIIIKAEQAVWVEAEWDFLRASIYENNGESWTYRYASSYTHPLAVEDPSIFERQEKDIAMLQNREAFAYIDNLRKAGFPFRTQLSNYYRRWSFSFTSLIVSIISSAMAGWFKHSILILSLGSSLGLAVIFYVFQMLTTLLAGNGFISPFAGAWLPFFVFFVISIILLKFART